MDVLNLAGGLSVEVDKLLTGWSSSSLFVIRGQARKKRAGLLSNTIRLVNTLGLFSGVVLAIEVIQGGEEAARDTMLLIKVDSTLSSGISNGITMSKIFCDDAASWLLFLGDFVAITMLVVCIMASIILAGSRCTCNLNLGSTELGVVEQQSRLGCGFFLELNSSILSLSNRSDFKAYNLSTKCMLAVATESRVRDS